MRSLVGAYSSRDIFRPVANATGLFCIFGVGVLIRK